jgi:predicted TIM-barrel fold metal-dependent hydrolase
MILDSHCHAWTYWPYQPPVPDPTWRGRAEQLLHEMDGNGVDQALVVCTQIENNPDNNAYIADQVAQYPGRLHQLADLDSEWSQTYHTSGSADRLRQMAARWPLRGFTHYLRREEDGDWLNSEEGQKLFQAAAELGLIASLSCYPHQQSAIRRAAERFPQVPILCHHMGFPRLGFGSLEENVQEILQSTRLSNIYLKLSGFAYSAATAWEYPYPDVRWIVQAIYEHFGAQRLCWGSDYPVVRFAMTYRQSLEAFRSHCDFVNPDDQAWILGNTLAGLLFARRSWHLKEIP